MVQKYNLCNMVTVILTIFLIGSIMAHPFSYTEVQQATRGFNLKQPLFLTASDDVQLAYYPFLPEQKPKAIIVFYHGGGAWSKAMYQLMAQETSQQQVMGVYLFDIRGHGYSQGERGDAPSSQQVWDDVDSAINFVKAKHPNVPVLLAGHSSGAGLLINYAAQAKDQKAASYIFLAPFLGSDSGTDIKYTDPEKEFVTKAKIWALIGYALTGGWLFAHTPAIFFNYSDINKTDTLMCSYYTCAMAMAIFPRDAKDILAKIMQPCALFIGQDDERFDPVKVLAFQEFLQNKNQSVADIVPDANHLSIVLKAPQLFKKVIENLSVGN